MKKVMFVCYGNICRSPMAEFMFRNYVERLGVGDEFIIKSSATSSEELGNSVYPPTKRILNGMGINCDGKRAVKLKAEDYEQYDYFIGMDEMNRRTMLRLFDGDKAGKVFLLLDFTKRKGEVADPWYTGDFEATRRDVEEGMVAFYEFLKNK